MQLDELLAELTSREIELRKSGDDLVAVGNRERLTEDLIAALRAHKAALLGLVPEAPQVAITPEMLPLVQLTTDQLEHLVRTVPGGAANVQDIYPLAPLQEGILFHVLLGGESDPYLIATLDAFESRRRLDTYLSALQTVIARHDILRTAVLWEDLPEPVQVVWRRAPLPVEEVVLDASDGDAATQLYTRFDPRRYRIDVRQAPLMRVAIAWDPAENRWLLMQRLHHLMSDHQTLELIEEEVERCLLGEEAQLPAPLPFRNIVAQARLGVSRDEHEAYFRQLLGDVTAPTAPFGLVNVRNDGTDVDVGRVRLDADLSRRLRAQARGLGVSAACLFHVAWAQVLARVSGRDDVVFGTTLFGRLHGMPGAQRVLGPSMNTLPVRLRIENHGAASAVRAMHAQLAALLRHEHAPLALAQRCSAVPAPTPLFSSLLNFRHNQPRRSRASTGIRGLQGETRSNYPLTLAVDDRGDGFGLTAQVTGAVQAARVCGYMHTALTSLVEALERRPHRPVHALEVLPLAERRQIVDVWNVAPEAVPASAVPLAAVFEAHVRLSPEAAVVVCEDGTLTYGELNVRANQVAHQLRGLGVRPDARVALCADRGIELIVGLLAVLKAGGAYVPLDPTYPEARLRGMLVDSAPVVLLADAHTRARCAALAASLPILDLTDAASWRGQPTSDPDHAAVGVTPEHLAYVIYTSGSTGTPKGVMVSQRAVAQYVAAIQSKLTLSPGANCGWVSTVAADLGYTMLFPALLGGGVLHVVPSAVSTDAERFAAYNRAHALEYLKITPSHFHALFGDGHTADAIPMRGLVFGGDILSASLVAMVHGLRPGCRIYNHYGPTECTVGVVSSEADVAAAATSGRMPLGRPLEHVHVLLLDGALNLVPANVDAEIYIGGAGVARGYLQRPEWTAVRFVPDPFCAGGARLYRTGDVGRWRPDGTIDFLGRSDRQVKIRGYRIELEEIEARLRASIGVREAVVVVREEPETDPRLVAYVVPEAETAYPLLAALRLAKGGGVLPARYELPNGMLVSHQNQNETDYLYREIFERQSYLQHGLTLRDNACVFDVGANIGLFTLFALERGPGATVYAFEPIPAVCDVLRLNTRLSGGNVHVFDCGLAASAGTALFAWFPHNSLLSGRYVDLEADTHTIQVQMRNEGRGELLGDEALAHVIAERLHYEMVTCPLRTLSEVIASEGVERIDLLKIDTQRSELEILEGLEAVDWEKIDQVVVEVHDIEGRLATIQRALTVQGFHVEVEQDAGLTGTEHYTVYARRRAIAAAASGSSPLPAIVQRYWSPSQLWTALEAELSAVLPEYMVPAVWVPLDALPLTANGKVDVSSLPAPEAVTAPSTPEYEAPIGEIETTVARVWAEVLKHERVSRRDNFFELGGHSLLAVRVIARLRQAGIRADIGALFATPTLADLAAAIDPAATGVSVPPNRIPDGCTAITPEMLPLVGLTADEVARIIDVVPGGAANVQDIYPLAPLQEGILFHALFEGAGDPYVLGSLYSFESRARLDAYLAALQAVIARHDILRTAFLWEGLPEPVQVVWRQAPLPTEEVTLDEEGGDVAAALYARYDPRRHGLDLRQAPLMRVAVAWDAAEGRWLLMHVQHHLIGDHVTTDAICTEIEAHLVGEDASLPAPRPFRNLVAQARLGMSAAEHEAYFRQLLGDVTEPTAPFGLLNVHGAVGAIETARVRLPAELSARLRAQARGLGVSAASLFHVAWAQVLARVSGRADVVFGTVLFGRMQGDEGAEQAFGLFMNTLPVRLRIEDDGAAEAVRAMHAQLAALLRHEHAPLALAQRCSAVPAPTPLFSSLLNYRYGRQVDAAARRASEGIREIRSVGRTNYPVALSVDDLGESFHVAAEVTPEVEAGRVVAYMQTALTSLVEALERAPERQVRTLEVLPEADRQQLVYEWNATEAVYPDMECLPALFETAARATPDAVAVVCDDHSLTYRALQAEAAQLAVRLRDLGVQPDTLVAISVERSLDLMIGVLGILLAGGAYLPLDLSYPVTRLQAMVEDSAPVALLTCGPLPERLHPLAAQLPILDLGNGWREQAHDAVGVVPGWVGGGLTPEHLAYVIYTSGSTGQPKGVMVAQRSVVNRLTWMQRGYGLGPGDTVLQKTPITFDVSVWELLWPVLVGARLVMARPEGHKDPVYLCDTIVRHGVTTVHFVPSMFELFLAEPAAARCTPLTRIVCSGEALPGRFVQQSQARLPQATVHNLYGPTEAAVDVTAWTGEAEAGAASVPIGRPMGNVQIYILDRHGVPTPVDVAGELYIGGVQVARGYLHRPALTAERFVSDPFGRVAGGRLYRTGDMARWRADGTIEFLGRTDFQVKLRGFRVELGEIEAQLANHPAVLQAAVIKREDQNNYPTLVAYVVPDREHCFTLLQMLHLKSSGELSDDVLYELPNSMRVSFENKAETDFLYHEIFDSESYLRHGITIDENACIFDVGANIGLFSLFAGARAPAAKIYAFEPIPAVFEDLRINTALYQPQTKIFNCGLAKGSGTASFTWYRHNSVISSRYADFLEDRLTVKSFLRNQAANEGLTEDMLDELLEERLEREQVTCQLRSLSSVIADEMIERIDLLKIDVEKSELDILEGIESHDWNKIRQIVVEVHDIEGRLATIVGILESHGYELSIDQDTALEATNLYNIYARRIESVQTMIGLRGVLPNQASTKYFNPARLIADLRGYLGSRLPDYMVPASYVMLEWLPLNSSGKLDRRALPAPRGEAYITRGCRAPDGPIETALAAIWADVLHVDRVGRHDNFFELGGHSLLAVRMVSRIRQVLGVEATIRDLFTYPVLNDFAHNLEGAVRTKLPPITVADRSKALPLSFAQQGLWFLAQMEGGSEAYHISFGLYLRGKLNRKALRQALDRIVARHEALRTTFELVDGEAVQRIAPVEGSQFHLVEQDLSGRDDAEEELRRLGAEEGGSSFDLEAGPLIRGQLIRLKADEHALLITMHHIVSDGWSMDVFGRELKVLYAAFARGEEDPLPPLPLQYADYAVWQQKWIDGDILREQAEYWKATLAGAPELLELPTDHARPSEQDYAGGFTGLELDAKLTAGLKELSKRHGTTLYMTLLAGWGALLGRLSGQQDVVIGTPVANRGRSEIEGLIGFFVNTLALRLDLAGWPTVGELLERVKAQALAAQEHQDIPFEQVVELVRPVRSLSHSPIFQVMVAWQNTPEGTLELPGVEIKPLSLGPHRAAKFDLTLSLREVGERIVGGAEYATSLFERSTVDHYLGYFRTLLEGMVADEEQVVDRLPSLPGRERQRILYEWNDMGTEFPSDKCIHELFEEQVQKTPDATALVFEEAKLSYRELNRRANQLGHYLRGKGVKPDTRVAICVERGLEMVVGLLAILKARGAYVPLDPAYPVERLRYMLEDSRPGVLLTQGHLQGLFSGIAENVLVLDLADTIPPWDRQSETDLDRGSVGLNPEHLAYVIYTSGSTGNPKGVMVDHANVVRLFAATDAWFEFGANDVWTLFHSYAFDFSVWEIWGALLYGGRLVIVPQDIARSPEDFYKLVCQEKVTILNQTPSAFRQLIAWQAKSQESHQLQQVIFGGEALEVVTLKPWYERNHGQHTRLINMYGITETTVHVTYRPLERADTERRSGCPIGRRIPDLRIYILDSQRQPVPVGVAGEFYIGGAGIARGYLNRPELTAERFLADPFTDEAGARMYRTGDVGRWLTNGTIEFLGRNDDQVKIRGYRIELGEIEAQLASYPAVREVVVLAREDEPGQKRLVAYYTVSDLKADFGAKELRASLKQKLPEYMVPAAYMQVERMPLTPSGKLDRRALPKPEEDAYAVCEYEAPRGETEKKLAEIWTELLKVERVGRHDNFFELGGHSLLAVTVIERLRRGGLQVDIRTMFATPTLSELAAAVGPQSNIIEIPPNRIPEGSQVITPDMLTLL